MDTRNDTHGVAQREAGVEDSDKTNQVPSPSSISTVSLLLSSCSIQSTPSMASSSSSIYSTTSTSSSSIVTTSTEHPASIAKLPM